MYEVLDWKINKCESLKNDLRRFVRKYIFGQMSSGQKDGGLSAAVMCSAVMCPAAKWVDTIQDCMTPKDKNSYVVFWRSDGIFARITGPCAAGDARV